MEIKRFVGLRNTTSNERLRNGELSLAQEVDLDNTGRLLTRKGYVGVNVNPGHSIFNNSQHTFLVQGTNLKAVEQDFSYTQLKVLSTDASVSYESVLDTTYYSNGVDTGRLLGRTPSKWGVDTPVGQPSSAPTTGTLPIGNYMYAITFVRNDGHESGTGIAGQINLPQGGGIAFTNIEVSTNPEVSGKMLYLSGTNGEILYRAAAIPNSLIQYNYLSDSLDLSIPLITQFEGPPPAGTIVRSYNGVMYVVSGDTVFFSKPYEYELFNRGFRFLRFPGSIAMLEIVDDGIFVGTADLGQESTGATWFLSGTRPDTFRSNPLYDYGVIEGTSVVSDASYFDSGPGDAETGTTRPAVVWTTRYGVCVGFNGGISKNLTEAKYSFPIAQRGAGLVRLHRGYVQYITTLQGIGAASNPF